MIYGFVATLAKVVITRIQSGDFEWLTVRLSRGAADRRGASARTSCRPRTRRARRIWSSPASPSSTRSSRSSSASSCSARRPAPRSGSYIAFGVAGAIAVWGVFQLARYHPQVSATAEELPIQRGSSARRPMRPPKTGSIAVTEAVSKVWPDPPVKDKGDGQEPLSRLRQSRGETSMHDPTVVHAALVTGRGRGCRHLDLSLPVSAGLVRPRDARRRRDPPRRPRTIRRRLRAVDEDCRA